MRRKNINTTRVDREKEIHRKYYLKFNTYYGI